MATHHNYTDEHLLYIHPYRKHICFWVVQCNREPWAKQYDYLASLTVVVKKEVSCLSHHYHNLGEMEDQRRLIDVKSIVTTTTV